jgi:hypothetical protein
VLGLGYAEVAYACLACMPQCCYSTCSGCPGRASAHLEPLRPSCIRVVALEVGHLVTDLHPCTHQSTHDNRIYQQGGLVVATRCRASSSWCLHSVEVLLVVLSVMPTLKNACIIRSMPCTTQVSMHQDAEHRSSHLCSA